MKDEAQPATTTPTIVDSHHTGRQCYTPCISAFNALIQKSTGGATGLSVVSVCLSRCPYEQCSAALPPTVSRTSQSVSEWSPVSLSFPPGVETRE